MHQAEKRTALIGEKAAGLERRERSAVLDEVGAKDISDTDME